METGEARVHFQLGWSQTVHRDHQLPTTFTYRTFDMFRNANQSENACQEGAGTLF
jgi:hypothetical protein